MTSKKQTANDMTKGMASACMVGYWVLCALGRAVRDAGGCPREPVGSDQFEVFVLCVHGGGSTQNFQQHRDALG
jgi:hypothetical protein